MTIPSLNSLQLESAIFWSEECDPLMALPLESVEMVAQFLNCHPLIQSYTFEVANSSLEQACTITKRHDMNSVELILGTGINEYNAATVLGTLSRWPHKMTKIYGGGFKISEESKDEEETTLSSANSIESTMSSFIACHCDTLKCIKVSLRKSSLYFPIDAVLSQFLNLTDLLLESLSSRNLIDGSR